METSVYLHTHRTSCRGGWPRGFNFLNPNPHSRHLSYLFTSATLRKPIHTATKCSTKPIQYVTPHSRDRRGAASLRYRNRAMSGQKQYPVWFSCRRKSCPIQLEHSLSNCFALASLCNSSLLCVDSVETKMKLRLEVSVSSSLPGIKNCFITFGRIRRLCCRQVGNVDI